MGYFVIFLWPFQTRCAKEHYGKRTCVLLSADHLSTFCQKEIPKSSHLYISILTLVFATMFEAAWMNEIVMAEASTSRLLIELRSDQLML